MPTKEDVNKALLQLKKEFEAAGHKVEINLYTEVEEKTELDYQAKRLEDALGMKVFHFADYGRTGFSFCVATELEAYKAAYIYRFSRVNVEFAPNVGLWLVQVYHKEN